MPILYVESYSMLYLYVCVHFIPIYGMSVCLCPFYSHTWESLYLYVHIHILMLSVEIQGIKVPPRHAKPILPVVIGPSVMQTPLYPLS